MERSKKESMAEAKTAIDPLSIPNVIFMATKMAATLVETIVAFFSIRICDFNIQGVTITL